MRVIARVIGVPNGQTPDGTPLLHSLPALLQFDRPPGATVQPGQIVDVIVRVEILHASVPGDVPG